VVSAYAVAFGGLLLLACCLADAAGRARLFRAGLVVFVVGSIAGGLAVEPGVLIASRVVQGTGAAMLAPASLSLLVTGRPGEQERSRTLGFYTAVASAGFASGTVLGSLLAEATWRLVFVNVPVGLGLLAASMRLLSADPLRRAERLDLPCAVSVTAGVALLVLAAARADDTLRAIQPALLAVAAIVLLGAFAAWERRTPTPPLDLGLLQDRGILGTNMYLIAVRTISAGEVLVVALYLQQGRGLSPLMTGLYFIPRRSPCPARPPG
jgi:MFS family permease